jgi:hypothetical protein
VTPPSTAGTGTPARGHSGIRLNVELGAGTRATIGLSDFAKHEQLAPRRRLETDPSARGSGRSARPYRARSVGTRSRCHPIHLIPRCGSARVSRHQTSSLLLARSRACPPDHGNGRRHGRTPRARNGPDASAPLALRGACCGRAGRVRPASRLAPAPSSNAVVRARPTDTLGVRLYEGGRVVNGVGCSLLGAAGGWWVSSGAHVSIAPSGRGDLAKSEWLVRRCMPEMSRQAARRNGAPAGAKGWFRVSMCQIASVSLRARSIWATLGPRWRPSRRLVCW